MILGEKIERKVYVNQQNFVSDIQLLIKHSFLIPSYSPYPREVNEWGGDTIFSWFCWAAAAQKLSERKLS